MAATVKSFSIQGIDGYPVDIEAGILTGERMSISIIGMGDTAVKESAERIMSALSDIGYTLPDSRIVLSLAPCDRKKRGTQYDLALAIALLSQAGSIKPKELTKYGFLGELSLGGKIRPVRGVLPMVIAAKEAGIRHVILPKDNLREAKLVSDIQVYPFDNLKDVIRFLEGKIEAPIDKEDVVETSSEAVKTVDFSDVKGQNDVVDAIVLAAAGGHNMLMLGTPGCGKTMLARRIPTILPSMSEEEALEITKIHSISGLLTGDRGLLTERPFRAPHHNVSLNAMIGGGMHALPGEVSLAHNGVLFLDEFSEYARSTLDALRQPIEDRRVMISRVSGTNTYPADFMLVAAMNPCPCGYYPTRKCRCTDYEIVKFRNRISGPILDRIDIQKHVEPVDLFDEKAVPAPSSRELKERVERARAIQKKRFEHIPGVSCNASMSSSLIDEFCVLDPDTRTLLKKACDKFGYSARVIHKLLRLARTSADLVGSKNIRPEDISYVLHLRDLDKSSGTLGLM